MSKRLLFVAEHVTVAQVVRLFMLARAAERAGHEVHFACASFDPLVFQGESFRRWPITSLSPAEAEKRIQSGARVHDQATLARYVDEERTLLDAVKPDLVIGDLRMSLSISAPVSKVRYAALINAYWSPYAVRARYPMPDHPIVRMLGVEMAEKYFPIAMPKVFAHFAKPVNALRRKHRLPELGTLAQVMTHGDLVLHPDVPSLVPTRGLPASHVFLGPLAWSPDLPEPASWASLGARPVVYVTLGSSGKQGALPIVLDALGGLDVDVILATAGRAPSTGWPPNVRAEGLVPGQLAARRAAVVVSNGGSSTGWQALAEGTPVVGVPFNLDQYLATAAIVDAGAGLQVRAGSATVDGVRAAVRAVLADERYRHAARRLAADLARHDAPARFLSLVEGRAPRRLDEIGAGSSPA